MKENKKSNIGLIIVLILIILGLSGYIVYDKVLNKDITTDIQENNTSKEDEQNVVKDKQQEDNKQEEKTEENGKKIIDDSDFVITGNGGFRWETLKFGTKLNKYNGSVYVREGNDGNYTDKARNYSISIKLNTHKIELCYDKDCNEIDKLSDVIDFAVVGDYPGSYRDVCFVLLRNGELYKYTIYYDKNNNKLEKLEDVSNVRLLSSFNYSKENAGGSWGVFALTSDNEYIQLFGASV